MLEILRDYRERVIQFSDIVSNPFDYITNICSDKMLSSYEKEVGGDYFIRDSIMYRLVKRENTVYKKRR